MVFKEDFPELHVVAAGSLLEFALKDLSSFGVGRIRSLFMYPMSFDEFLMSQGKEGLLRENKLPTMSILCSPHSIMIWYSSTAHF